MTRLLILTALLTFLPVAHATKSFCTKNFEELYEEKGFACDGECDTTVQKFLKKLEEKKPGSTKNIKVLYLSPVLPDEKVITRPNAPRSGTQEHWFFHAVLELNGKILDFDRKVGKPIEAEAYFEEMFGDRQLKVRAMPAALFLRDFPPPPPPEPRPGTQSYAENRLSYEYNQDWYRQRKEYLEEQLLQPYLRSLDTNRGAESLK